MPNEDREQLIEQVKGKAVVRGRVTLASGKEADYYVDMRRVTLDGAAAPLVGSVMRELVADWDFDAVGGLTLGADPVAGATSSVFSAAPLPSCVPSSIVSSSRCVTGPRWC